MRRWAGVKVGRLAEGVQGGARMGLGRTSHGLRSRDMGRGREESDACTGCCWS